MGEMHRLRHYPLVHLPRFAQADGSAQSPPCLEFFPASGRQASEKCAC
jgi:hypothetical protein